MPHLIGGKPELRIRDIVRKLFGGHGFVGIFGRCDRAVCDLPACRLLDGRAELIQQRRYLRFQRRGRNSGNAVPHQTAEVLVQALVRQIRRRGRQIAVCYEIVAKDEIVQFVRFGSCRRCR